jgi:uncharacterized protein YbjQ (UPF0145 family)
MLIINSDHPQGYKITEYLGTVRGNTVRAKNIGKDIMAALRSIIGGEVKEYTEMLIESRNESIDRLRSEADQLNADAVINLRFVTSQVMAGASELLAYGTAVKMEKIDD